jgi:DamX protein
MPANHYVVQLLAAHTKSKVDRYAAVAGRSLPVYVYQTRRDGKPWYVVVAGPYRDRAAARAAIAGLPKGLREGQPWLRSVASMQADIHASG